MAAGGQGESLEGSGPRVPVLCLQTAAVNPPPSAMHRCLLPAHALRPHRCCKDLGWHRGLWGMTEGTNSAAPGAVHGAWWEDVPCLL